MDNNDRMLTSGEACKFLHICRNTLLEWESEGLITSTKTMGGHRRYLKSDLMRLIGHSMFKKPRKITIGYCRVSSIGQREDLERQEVVVSRFCEVNGYRYKIIKDIGSGLNYNKKGLRNLITEICEGEVERVVINYKDRLVRFGYELIEQICEINDVELVIINETKDISKEKELVEDILAIITVFSSKLYGNRSHRNKRIIEENRKLFNIDDKVEKKKS